MAIESYEKAISHKPDYADAFCNMGVSFKHKGDFDKAIKAYKKAISLKHDYPEAYSNIGNALQVTGKLEEANEAYKKAISLFNQASIANITDAEYLLGESYSCLLYTSDAADE